VHQQLEEVRKLHDEMNTLAKATAEMLVALNPNPGMVALGADVAPETELANTKQFHKTLEAFLRQANTSDKDIEAALAPVQKLINNLEIQVQQKKAGTP
jgi:hypothetical protein